MTLIFEAASQLSERWLAQAESPLKVLQSETPLALQIWDQLPLRLCSPWSHLDFVVSK